MSLRLPRVVYLFLRLCVYVSRVRSRIRRSSDEVRKASRHRSQFYRDVWSEAAEELGATLHVFTNDVYRIQRNGASTRVNNNNTALDDVITHRIASDKSLVYATLCSHGLPTPPHLEFALNDLVPAYNFLTEHGRCVVKPAAGTGAGEGVTTGIESRRQLLMAAVRAAGYNSRLLVEGHVNGDNLRLMYLDGQLLDAVKRSSPSVVGDGKSRISELVTRLNEARLDAGYQLAQVTLNHDLDMKRTLAGQGLSWRSVPALERRVVLKRVINDNMAEDNESVKSRVSESIIAAGRRATEVIGIRLAGVDIITQDYRQGLEASGGIILEVNAGPGYHYHYFSRTGGLRVAVPILKACLDADASAHGVKRRGEMHV